MAHRGSSKHRPGFHAISLAFGCIAGGAMQQASRICFSGGAAKQFLTAGVTPTLGPLSIDLVLIKFAIGPVALDVSLLSLVGVLVAYLIARSLF